jgi:hypothetical protein
MSAMDWAALAVALATLMGIFLSALRFLILHYLSELKPNSGSSVKDQVTRLETRVDEIYRILLNKSLS